MGLVMEQYTICLVNLNPAIGREIRKPHPCVIISPDEMNRNIATVIIAPMTTKAHAFPTRVPLTFRGKNGWIVLDQIRTVDKRRIMRKLGRLNSNKILEVKNILSEMLVE
jgi:mRNA interferase MazF